MSPIRRQHSALRRKNQQIISEIWTHSDKFYFQFSKSVSSKHRLARLIFCLATMAVIMNSFLSMSPASIFILARLSMAVLRSLRLVPRVTVRPGSILLFTLMISRMKSTTFSSVSLVLEEPLFFIVKSTNFCFNSMMR